MPCGKKGKKSGCKTIKRKNYSCVELIGTTSYFQGFNSYQAVVRNMSLSEVSPRYHLSIDIQSIASMTYLFKFIPNSLS